MSDKICITIRSYPIKVAALRRLLDESPHTKKNFCAIGKIHTNTLKNWLAGGPAQHATVRLFAKRHGIRPELIVEGFPQSGELPSPTPGMETTYVVVRVPAGVDVAKLATVIRTLTDAVAPDARVEIRDSRVVDEPFVQGDS